MKTIKNVILNPERFRGEESLIVHISMGSFARLRMTNVVTQIIERARLMAQYPKGSAVSVVFIGDKKMRALNKQYRGKDKTTNVLAFATAPHPRSLSLGERVSGGRVRDLGDIFISLPEAKREAKKYGWTLKYEIARLALHGFLHLLGYDHEKEKDAKKMEGLEQKILKKYVER